MRIQFWMLAVCLSVSAALATDYALYSPDGSVSISGGPTWNVSVTVPKHESFQIAANALAHAQTSAASAAVITALTNTTLAELAAAKASDSVYIQGVSRNVLLRYNQCDVLDGYRACFKGITYLEEDGPPLGDTHLATVKISNGSVQLPVIISAVAAAGKLNVLRTFSITTPYPGQEVTVTVRVSNVGTAPVDSVRITDSSPFTPIQGAMTAFSGALADGEDLAVTYIIKPSAPGSYPFHATFQPATLTLADVNLTVKHPVILSANVTPGIAGIPQPISISFANNFGADVVISTAQLASPASIVLANVSLDRTDPHALVLHGFTIHAGSNYTINGTLTPDALTNGTLFLSLAYAGALAGSESLAVPYSAREQGIDLVPDRGAASLQLTLTSTATERIDSVVLDWGDGKNDTVGFLGPGRTLSLSHTYATTVSSPVQTHISYTLRGVLEVHGASYAVPGIGAHVVPSAAGSANSTAATPSKNITASAVGANTTPPSLIAPASGATAPAHQSWLSRVWNWLTGLFH